MIMISMYNEVADWNFSVFLGASISVFANYLQHFDDKNCVGYNFVH